MTAETRIGIPMSGEMLSGYFKYLINHFFKILPLKEGGEKTLTKYIEGFQAELMGCNEFILAIRNDPLFVSLISILQFLIDNPECSVTRVRREVFDAITICNNLRSRYAMSGEDK